MSFGASFSAKGKGALGFLNSLAQRFLSLRMNLINLGITLIFVDRIFQSLARGFKALNAAVGIDEVTAFAFQVRTLSEYLGVAEGRLQGFVGAARNFGLEVADVNRLMTTLNDRVERAARGQGFVKEFFLAGLSPGALQRLDGVDRILAVADRLQDVDPADRARVAGSILGSGIAQQFGPLLAEGSQGVLRRMQQFERKGGILTPAQIQQANDFREAMFRVGQTVGVIRQNMAMAFLPTFERVLRGMEYFGEVVSAFVNFEGPRFSAMLRVLFLPIEGFFRAFDMYVDKFQQGWHNVIFRSIRASFVILTAMLWLMFGPIVVALGAMAAGFLAVMLLVDSIISMFLGEESLIANLIKSNQHVRTMVGVVAFLVDEWRKTGTAVKDFVVELLKSPKFLTTMLWTTMVLVVSFGLLWRGIVLVIDGMTTLVALTETFLHAITLAAQIYAVISPAMRGTLKAMGIGTGLSDMRASYGGYTESLGRTSDAYMRGYARLYSGPLQGEAVQYINIVANSSTPADTALWNVPSNLRAMQQAGN